MGQSLAIPRVIPEDWKRLDLIVNKIKFHLGSTSSPIFTGITLSGLSDGSVIFVDNNGALSENNSAFNWNDISGRLDITSILRVKNSDGDVIFYVDDDEMYFTASVVIPIEAGMPIGLALALTYASP